MDVSIQSVKDRLDPFLYELGSLHYRFGAGLSNELPLEKLYASYPELSLPESFAAVREAAERTGTEPDERRRLKHLLEFLAGQVEDALAAPAAEAVAALEAGGQIQLPGQALPWREALAALSREPLRERRQALERAASDFLLQHQDAWARWRESGSRAAQALGFRSYLALREAATGESLAELAAQCELVLRQTEDAYRDLLGYALKRLEPELKALPAGAARRHDVQRAVTAPWLAGHYRREDLLPSTTRWLSDMGFDPHAQGRIQVDSEDRPGKTARAFVADLSVPDDVRLVVRPGGGLEDYSALLHHYGHALHLAHVAKTAPVEDRRLGDPAVTQGFACLFDHALFDPAWHKRYLRLPQSPAEDGARLAAFGSLMLLRRACAELPYELALYERGPLRPLAESFEDRQTAALLVGIPRGFYLYDVEPQLRVTRSLKAWALEARLHRTLLDRFDEDWWRNPATSRWLKDLFARGQPERADELGQRFGKGAPSLADAGQRLVDALDR